MSRALFVCAALATCTASKVIGPPYNTTWFTSRTASALATSKDGVMTWGLEEADSAQSVDAQPPSQPRTKTTAEVIITNLDEPVSLSATGDSFSFGVNWLSAGTNKSACPASYYAGGKYCLSEEKDPCTTHTVECLTGTGDFRIAFFDTSSSAGQVSSDNFAATLDYSTMRELMQKKPFVDWRGYVSVAVCCDGMCARRGAVVVCSAVFSFDEPALPSLILSHPPPVPFAATAAAQNLHFFPHVSKDAKKYAPSDRGEAVPSSFCYRSASDSAKEAWPFTNHKLGDPFGGFAADEGTWQELLFSVKNTGAREFTLSVSANGLSYSQAHKWASGDGDWVPKQVDSVGIIYPNERGYAHVQMHNKYKLT